MLPIVANWRGGANRQQLAKEDFPDVLPATASRSRLKPDTQSHLPAHKLWMLAPPPLPRNGADRHFWRDHWSYQTSQLDSGWDDEGIHEDLQVCDPGSVFAATPRIINSTINQRDDAGEPYWGPGESLCICFWTQCAYTKYLAFIEETLTLSIGWPMLETQRRWPGFCPLCKDIRSWRFL